MTQYVKIQFNPWDRQSYTYHNNGDPAGVGDRVQVTTMRGKVEVEVVGLTDDKPPFDTKPINKIVKRAPPEPAPMHDDEIPFGEEPEQ